ncbi:enoyl-CoA hydratase-related protein [Glycomyces salinus]|uniref:enoyl-CoA hydratase-related protein n=1 Tax=Glycomyces salinus TaxID=980294 RepID=UPI0018ECA1B3|nr:enoyl-CoA hydratase-related protein [Glycomyces salinus]
MNSNDALTDYRVEAGVATVALDDPKRRNALSTRLIGELRKSLARAVADPAVRVIVLDHAGPVFCAGADLRESAAATRTEDLPAAHLAELLADMCEAPKPIVAHVRGPARGGGMGLIAAADHTVCGPGARMAFSEVKLGVVPAVIAPVVARKLSPGLLRELFLTGRDFDGEQAAAWGLVSDWNGRGTGLRGVLEGLKAGGPGAQAGIKVLTGDPDLRRKLREAAALTAEYFFSEEGREGVRSFLEKDSPSWVH